MKVMLHNGVLEKAEREITVYDLLTHNSGLSYHWNKQIGGRYRQAGITSGLGPDADPIGEDVRALARIPLAQQPGTGFLYGLNTDVLGYLVEVVSGTTLDRFFQDRFFAPLSMNDTAFFLDEGKTQRLAQLYIRNEQGETNGRKQN